MTRDIDAEGVAVYSGREPIGRVNPRGDQFEAMPLAGDSLGLFRTASAAATAVARHHHACRAADPAS
jgi:hypothetical protein